MIFSQHLCVGFLLLGLSRLLLLLLLLPPLTDSLHSVAHGLMHPHSTHSLITHHHSLTTHSLTQSHARTHTHTRTHLLICRFHRLMHKHTTRLCYHTQHVRFALAGAAQVPLVLAGAALGGPRPAPHVCGGSLRVGRRGTGAVPCLSLQVKKMSLKTRLPDDKEPETLECPQAGSCLPESNAWALAKCDEGHSSHLLTHSH